jgi:tetratricopeptide (TPR) repeat protein
MLRFSNIDMLWLLTAIPLSAIGLWFAYRSRRKSLQAFVSESLLPVLAAERSMAKWITKQVYLLLAAAFLILALADPQVGTRLEEVKREGIDLFVALDVSLSMKSEDIRPSRLEKAKRDVSELLKKLAGDRVGLIVFAGEAFIQFPLTTDYSAADLFLTAVDVDAVPVPGTMIGNAITLALKSFPTDAPTKKAIVVVSDGENTEGDVMSAVEEAKKAGVRVYGVGMGTTEGGPIPMYDGSGNRSDYKRDGSGSIVLSKLDETMLQQISAATGGSYHRSTNSNEIDKIFNELATLERTEFASKQISGFESRYQWPLCAGLFFLLLELLVSDRRTRWVAWVKRLIPGGAAAVLLLLAVPASAQTSGSHIREGNRIYEKGRYDEAEVAYRKALERDSKSTPAQFNLGNSQYKQQRFDEAARSFNSSTATLNTSEEKAASWHNLGNAMYRAEKYPESMEAYRRALKLNPSDDDTRYNLLMAREKLKQQQQQKKDQKNKDDNKKQDQQQDQQKNQQQQQQQQQQKNEQAKQDQTQQQQKRNQMPKEEAERILEAMKNNEKDLQKQLRKRQAVRVQVEKDW